MNSNSTSWFRRHWPITSAILWVIFASITPIIGHIRAPWQCTNYDQGPYWFLVGYTQPAVVVTVLTIPLLIILGLIAARKWLLDVPIESNIGNLWLVFIGLMLIAQIVGCYGIIVWFVGAHHLDAVVINQTGYYLAECNDELDYGAYQLYECDPLGLSCRSIVYGSCFRGQPCGPRLRADVTGQSLYIELHGEIQETIPLK